MSKVAEKHPESSFSRDEYDPRYWQTPNESAKKPEFLRLVKDTDDEEPKTNPVQPKEYDNKLLKATLHSDSFNRLSDWTKGKEFSAKANLGDLQAAVTELETIIKAVAHVSSVEAVDTFKYPELSTLTEVYRMADRKLGVLNKEMKKTEKDSAHSLYAMCHELEQWVAGKAVDTLKTEADLVDATDDLRDIIELRAQLPLENINEKSLAELQPDLAKAIEYATILYKKTATKVRKITQERKLDRQGVPPLPGSEKHPVSPTLRKTIEEMANDELTTDDIITVPEKPLNGPNLLRIEADGESLPPPLPEQPTASKKFPDLDTILDTIVAAKEQEEAKAKVETSKQPEMTLATFKTLGTIEQSTVAREIMKKIAQTGSHTAAEKAILCDSNDGFIGTWKKAEAQALEEMQVAEKKLAEIKSKKSGGWFKKISNLFDGEIRAAEAELKETTARYKNISAHFMDYTNNRIILSLSRGGASIDTADSYSSEKRWARFGPNAQDKNSEIEKAGKV